MPHIGMVGNGTFQLHKMCRAVSPVFWFGAEHPEFDAFSHTWISARFNFSATPECVCQRIFGQFWNTTRREGLLAAACLSCLGAQLSPESPGAAQQWSGEKKREPGRVPGGLQTKEPLVPVKELGLSDFIISFHANYWMLKLQGVRSYFVTNTEKIIIILAKFIYFSQKMLHFVNSFPACWQRISHQLFTQVATSLSSPSATQSSMATEWVTAQLTTRLRVDPELDATYGTQGATSPCHAQPAAEQPG